MKDGQDEGLIFLDLPQVPLSNDQEEVIVSLEEPTGIPAKLGGHKSCVVTVKHDNGEYILSFGLGKLIIKYRRR